jgi:hypothetical protein
MLSFHISVNLVHNAPVELPPDTVKSPKSESWLKSIGLSENFASIAKIWLSTPGNHSGFGNVRVFSSIWYALWMALVSRNLIRLALICVLPFGCGG